MDSRTTGGWTRRRILCVAPRLSTSMSTMNYAFPLLGVKAFSPPLGLLVTAGYLPDTWEVRFVDENVRKPSARDFRWADAVFLTGMHIQADYVRALDDMAHSYGKLTVLGGPSASAAPEWYPNVDLLHVGELGDATEDILRRIDADASRPARQEIYVTQERLPLSEFPLPAYDLVDARNYAVGTLQCSSGCPYACEFCDIPELYGRNPRFKAPAQVVRELDALLARGNPGCIYIVDDNFIGNRRQAVAVLEEIIRWQKERGYPVQFAFLATLNLAQAPDLMERMRQARFHILACGIETPEIEALVAMDKKQNTRQPVVDAVHTLNGYGFHLVSGIILGLDTDTPETGARIEQFIDDSQIPLLLFNLLQALPGTPLWRRLEVAGRLLDDPDRDSNVDFLVPYEQVRASWRRCMMRAYDPDALYDRFDHQFRHTFGNRLQVPPTRARINAANLWRGLRILTKLFYTVGLRSDYRRRFWRTAWPALRQRRIEELIEIAQIGHHAIQFARAAGAGRTTASLLDPRPESSRTPLASGSTG